MNRIILGDCITELRQLPSNSVDLLCTDPPYGDGIGYGRFNRTIVNNPHPLVGLMAVAESYRLLKRNRAAYVFLGMKHLPITRQFVESYTDFRVRDFLIWDKQHIGMGTAFRFRYEVIAVLEKGHPRYRSRSFANVINVARVPTPEHPHTKPVPLIEQLITHSTDKGDVVLDPFLGSGTTAVAARASGRRFIGIECMPRYVQVAQQRLQTM